MDTTRSEQSQTRVGIGEIVLATDETLVIHGVGSCLAVGVYDADHDCGGLAHVLLPAAPSDVGPAERGRYADTAVVDLIQRFRPSGSARSGLVANLAGGSNMFGPESPRRDLGARNVAAAEAVLQKHNVPIITADTGGTSGRTVRFTPTTGEFTVERRSGAE